MQSSTISNRITWLGVGVLAVSIFATSALAGGGHVIPTTEKPRGYSLSDMAKATAFFNTSWPRDPKDTPNTPFQILYYYQIEIKGEQPKTEQGTFTVGPGTMLYVPILYSDDTPPVVGDFPDVSNQAAVLNYFTNPAEFGNVSIAIVVDGIQRPLGPDYVVGVGPVRLNDAGPNGTPGLRYGNYIVAAAFLTPLNKGEHEVGLYFKCIGAALNGTWEDSRTYKVTVK
jgi:hypothetical protein